MVEEATEVFRGENVRMNRCNQSDADKYLKELQARDHEISKLNEQLVFVKRELERCSQTDALTGVYNRLVFESVLRKEWERCKRHVIPISLLIVDIDCFKDYNDTYGYQDGDDCLRKVAACLMDCARRSSDTVSRFGGDKFIIIVPHLMKTNAFDLASQIKDRIFSLQIPHTSSPVAQQVTVSVGVHTVTPADDLSIQDFIRVAEIALYEAKQDGNAIVIE
ncbi:MAG: GGDEF domain-containing protein [Alphaproteobacteria bacterium]